MYTEQTNQKGWGRGRQGVWTKNLGILHYEKLIGNNTFIKSQAKRYMRRVFSSHFINHFNHKAVSALLMLCKRGPTVRLGNALIPGPGEPGFISTLSSKSQERDGSLMQVQQDEH